MIPSSVIQSNYTNMAPFTLWLRVQMGVLRGGGDSLFFDTECWMTALSSCMRYCLSINGESRISWKNVDCMHSRVSRVRMFDTSASISSMVFCALSIVCIACFFFKMAEDHRWDCSLAWVAKKPIFGDTCSVRWVSYMPIHECAIEYHSLVPLLKAGVVCSCFWRFGLSWHQALLLPWNFWRSHQQSSSCTGVSQITERWWCE